MRSQINRGGKMENPFYPFYCRLFFGTPCIKISIATRLPWSQCQCLCQIHCCGVWRHVWKSYGWKNYLLIFFLSKLWLLYISVWCQLLDHIFSTRSNFEYNEHTLFLQDNFDYLDSTIFFCLGKTQTLSEWLCGRSLLIKFNSNMNILDNRSG